MEDNVTQPAAAAEPSQDTEGAQDAAPPAEPAKQAKSRRPLIIGGIVTAAVVVAAIIGTVVVVNANKTITVRGSMAILEDPTPSKYDTANFVKLGDDRCAGTGGYSDLREGASVAVYGKTGQTLGLGALDESFYLDDMCIFTYEVLDVPAGEGFYAVEVTHRGKLSEPESSVEDGVLAISGTIGD